MNSVENTTPASVPTQTVKSSKVIALVLLILGQLLFLFYPHLVFCGAEFTACGSSSFSFWSTAIWLIIMDLVIFMIFWKKIHPSISGSFLYVFFFFYMPLMMIAMGFISLILPEILKYINYYLFSETLLTHLITAVFTLILALMIGWQYFFKHTLETKNAVFIYLVSIMIITASLIYGFTNFSYNYTDYLHQHSGQSTDMKSCKKSLLLTGNCINKDLNYE